MKDTEAAIAASVRQIVTNGDLETLTVRIVMKQVGEQLGIAEMKPYKRFVAECVDSAISAIEADDDEAPSGSSAPAAESDADADGNPTAEDDDEPDEDDDEPRPRRKKRLKVGGRKVAGINKPMVVLSPLRELLGKDVMPRTHIQKGIMAYVKENGLQDPDDGRKVNCDDVLRNCFGVDDFTIFSVNKHITNLIKKPEECSKELQDKAAALEAEMQQELDNRVYEEPVRKKKKRKVDPDAPKRQHPRMKLSPELAAVCGTTHLSRFEVVKKLWEYIRENNLQDEANRRNILCDDPLQRVFDNEKVVTAFSMNKYLSKHLTKDESYVEPPPQETAED
mmetsp:Transcript_34721/g.84990  ORF Transcript_34721/g.84990 Transcript_34721/m.84990 type:complete len:336 (+) Transcript_34721:67-1074(+)